MNINDLENMSRDEILEILGEIDIEQLKRTKEGRASVLPEVSLEDELLEEDELLYTDEEFEKIVEERGEVIQTESNFTSILEDTEFFNTLNDTEKETVLRWVDIEDLRAHYTEFEDFLYDCMTSLMGFECSELQIDIGKFLQYGPRLGMIQAQRSQAKSTIVAIFAVWQLIHDCKHRVLIISAGSEVAMEIANWVIQIIMNWDILECMRPDRTHGDRASTKAFDVHWQLKGPEKSPSVACIGITANMQGRRADLLIPDDIESSKNGTTEVQRAALEHLSKDFSSICQSGRIMYLGTPQTIDSIYNNLSERGFQIRVWTGRYPTLEEEKHYGDTLAPFLVDQMNKDASLRIGGGLGGDRGMPTDPMLLGEEKLCSKELDQGQAYFNLQHMLNTELSDNLRHPLKTKNLIVMPFDFEKGAGELSWLPSPTNRIPAQGFSCKPEFYGPFTVSSEFYKYEGKHMYVDPAGGGKNGDETVAAVTYFLHGYVFLAEILKLPGGYGDEVYTELSKLALRHNVNSIDVEKNFGFGALAASWRPILHRAYEEAGRKLAPAIEEPFESGQKELRMIDTLEPIMARHRLIVHTDIIQYDLETTNKYPIDQRESYKFFHQLSKVTRERGSLIHDDSLDAVAGSVRKWTEMVAVDETKRIEQKEYDESADFFAEWGAKMGKHQQRGVLGNSTNRFQRHTNRRTRR